jgi:hypothetical protein
LRHSHRMIARLVAGAALFAAPLHAQDTSAAGSADPTPATPVAPSTPSEPAPPAPGPGTVSPAAPPAAPAPPVAAAPAAPAAPPVAAATGEAEGDAGRSMDSHFNLGIGVALAAGLGTRPNTSFTRPGVVIEGRGTYPLSRRFDAGFRFAWGLTEFRRFPDWIGAGTDVAEWTTRAYQNTYDWTRKRGRDGTLDPDLRGLRMTGAIWAMAVIWLGYVAAGVVYATAVVSPTTWVEANGLLGYNFGDRNFNPAFHGGLALFGFIHPVQNTLAAGIGPTIAPSVSFGPVRFGANFTMSPSPVHTSFGTGPVHLLMGGLTLSGSN